MVKHKYIKIHEFVMILVIFWNICLAILPVSSHSSVPKTLRISGLIKYLLYAKEMERLGAPGQPWGLVARGTMWLEGWNFKSHPSEGLKVKLYINEWQMSYHPCLHNESSTKTSKDWVLRAVGLLSTCKFPEESTPREGRKALLFFYNSLFASCLFGSSSIPFVRSFMING